jgi:hypothetical protein
MMKWYEQTLPALMSLITFSPCRLSSALPSFFSSLAHRLSVDKTKEHDDEREFMDLCDGDSAGWRGKATKILGKLDIILGLIVTKGLFEEFINK